MSGFTLFSERAPEILNAGGKKVRRACRRWGQEFQ